MSARRRSSHAVFMGAAANDIPKPTKRSHSPITLRLTSSERERLEKLAAGMTLSAYIRACLFETEDKRRPRRSKILTQDKEEIAQILSLLGQSRIANNLNQIAHHANLGMLEIDPTVVDKIEEAYGYIYDMRDRLVKALRSG